MKRRISTLLAVVITVITVATFAESTPPPKPDTYDAVLSCDQDTEISHETIDSTGKDENAILDADGKAVSVVNAAGTVLQQGDSSITVTVDEAAEYEYDLRQDGTAEIWRYDGPGGEVAIPDTLDGCPVSCIEYRAFSDCVTLTGVTIPETVTRIGDCAFEGCTALTQVTLPGALQEIGERAFYGCSGLTDIVLPDSLVSIGCNAFDGCVKLAEITLPESLRQIGVDAFDGSTHLFGNVSLLSPSNP